MFLIMLLIMFYLLTFYIAYILFPKERIFKYFSRLFKKSEKKDV